MEDLETERGPVIPGGGRSDAGDFQSRGDFPATPSGTATQKQGQRAVLPPL